MVRKVNISIKFSYYHLEITSIYEIISATDEFPFCTSRLLWLFLCIGSAVFGCFLCYPIVMKWINFPTITTILQTNFPVSEIPFPAVTICPNNKVFGGKLIEAIQDENGPYVFSSVLSYDKLLENIKR